MDYDTMQYVTSVAYCWACTWEGSPERYKYLSAGFCQLGKSHIDACIRLNFPPPMCGQSLKHG